MIDEGQSRKCPFADDGEKKRTVKACDRCKLKKIKCCGQVPCTRCQQRDTICHFGFATGRDEKSVSAAHVNQLQLHNEILVKALRLMWERYAQPTLRDDRLKEPSVHDIVRSLGVLQTSTGRTHAGFDTSILDKVDFDTYDSSAGVSSAIHSSPEGHNDRSILPSFDLDRAQAYSGMPFLGKLDTDLEPPDLVSSRTSSAAAATDSTWSSINHFRALNSAMPTLSTPPQSSRTSSLNRPNKPTSKISMPKPFASDFVGQGNPGLSSLSRYSQPESALQQAYAPIDMSMMTPGLDWDSLVDTRNFSSGSPSWGQAVA